MVMTCIVSLHMGQDLLSQPRATPVPGEGSIRGQRYQVTEAYAHCAAVTGAEQKRKGLIHQELICPGRYTGVHIKGCGDCGVS